MDDPKRANLDAVSKSDTIPGGVPEELDDAALAAEQEAAAKAEPDIRTVLDNAGDIQGLNELLAGLNAGDKDTVNFVAGLAQASRTDRKALEDMVSNWQEAKRAQE